MRTCERLLVCAAVCAVILAYCASAAAQLGAKDFFPEAADPLMGEYVGRWSENEEVDPDICAQVIGLAGGKYRIILASKLDMRCPPKLDLVVAAEKGRLKFKDGVHFGECDGEIFTGGRGGNATFSMKKVARVSPTLGRQAPDGAIVLFDGGSLDAWEGSEGWELTGDGALMVTPKGKYLTTRQTFTDVEMHIEFRTPYMPASSGQQRGNSGVFFQGEYEVQVLDSFGLPGYYDECGALYKVAAPMVNACLPPLSWQTYDIAYRGPRRDAAGNITEHARMTVHHNGVLIHRQQELPWITAWKEKERLAPPPSGPGPIKLQGHNNYVQFRNIWVVPAD